MNFITMPDFVVILWMAIVLATLRRKREGHFMRLWIGGLGMIVIEGIARIVYLRDATLRQHTLSHIVALDAYLLAGLAFFQSAVERLRSLPRPYLYLAVCAVPYILLLTGYGGGLMASGFFISVAMLGLLSGIFAAEFLAKSFRDSICHTAIWVPVLALSIEGMYRSATYYALFAVFATIAISFFFALPQERWGRVILVVGFGVWSLCFLSHPWIGESHPHWIPFAERIWDLQKFVVTFGLLILTLEEVGAANEYDALHDTLTGLPNRRLFADRLQQDLARARRGKTRVLLFNIDMDHFKHVNDNWGHQAGDILLKEITCRLRTVTRETDTLARIGGDEFYLIVNDSNRLDSTNSTRGLIAYLTGMLRSAVEEQPCVFELNGAHIHLHARLSVGCAVFPSEGGNQDELCRIADLHMYEDKRSRQSSGASASNPRTTAVGTLRDSGSASHRVATPLSQ